MDIQFTGKIIAAMPIMQGVSKRDGKQWVKQEYVIEELNQRFPGRCCFQVFGSDKLQQMNIQPGEVVTVHLGVNCNQAQDGRWFNQVDCWKVERFGAQQSAYAPQAQPAGQTFQSSMNQPAPQTQFPPQAALGTQQTYKQPQSGAGQQGNLPF